MDNLSFGIVALGANLPSPAGSAQETLRATFDILHTEPTISISRVSRLWNSAAVPAGSGPDFVNAALTLRTALSAPQLLALLHRIEAALGRDRSSGRWSPRVLDLDLIALDDHVLPDVATQRAWMTLPPAQQQVRSPDRLILPHPRMQDRGFVLAPLAEIAPNWRHPVLNLTVRAMLNRLPAAARAGLHPLPDGNSGSQT